MIPQYPITQTFSSFPLNDITEKNNNEKTEKFKETEAKKTDEEKKIIENQLKLILEKLENKNEEVNNVSQKKSTQTGNPDNSALNNENLKETKFLQIEENTVKIKIFKEI
jgi:hypothetical protein